MKNDHRNFIMLTLTAMIILAISSVIFLEITIPDPDPYYYTQHSGIIIGKNETRLAFYIETKQSVTMVTVGSFEFQKYEIGDVYEWELQHHRQSITNMTMIQSW